MRILHLVHQYPPEHVGGTELYAQTLAQAQVRRGHQVSVVAPASLPPGKAVVGTEETGVDVYRLPLGRRSSTGVFRSTFGNSRLAAGLAEVMDRVQPDIVHIEHLMGWPAAAMLDLLTERHIPYVIALHDYWYRCANAQLLTNTDQSICDGPDALAVNCARCALARAGLPGALATAVSPVMRRRNDVLGAVFAAAGCVIAPNEFVRSIVTGLGLPSDRLVVVPWGMDLPADLPQIRQAADSQRAASHVAPLRLGYMGSLSHQKGIHVLVEAVNALPANGVTLDIYGNPSVFPNYVAELRRLATHPGIRMAGLVPRAEVWSRLAELDVLVLPTLWYEASPLTIDEAFAAGTPVVGSDIGALPSMIRDSVDGLLFPPGDAVALTTLLQALHAQPEQVAALRSAIRPVKTMDTHAAEIDALYDAIATHREIER